MTIDELGSLGELIGAIATIATLLYLALQIRNSNRATDSETQRSLFERRLSDFDSIIASNEVADIFLRGLADPDSLQPSESLRFTFLISKMMASLQLTYSELERGLGDREDAERTLQNLRQFLITPGGQAFWKRNGHSFSDQFRDKVERVLAEPGAR